MWGSWKQEPPVGSVVSGSLEWGVTRPQGWGGQRRRERPVRAMCRWEEEAAKGAQIGLRRGLPACRVGVGTPRGGLAAPALSIQPGDSPVSAPPHFH